MTFFIMFYNEENKIWLSLSYFIIRKVRYDFIIFYNEENKEWLSLSYFIIRKLRYDFLHYILWGK